MDTIVQSVKTHRSSSYDIEYIGHELFNRLSKQLDMLFPTRHPFHLLDVGGGSGLYADKVLDKYPSANVTIVEPDKNLLGLNRPHHNKQLCCSRFEKYTFEQKYDIIQFNWVLHHVVANTYYETTLLQQQALQSAHQHLNDQGMVVIFENFHEGILVNNMINECFGHGDETSDLDPSIRHLISSPPYTSVCFHNRSTWHDMLLNAGFDIVLHVPFHTLRSLDQFNALPVNAKQQNSGLLIAKKTQG